MIYQHTTAEADRKKTKKTGQKKIGEKAGKRSGDRPATDRDGTG